MPQSLDQRRYSIGPALFEAGPLKPGLYAVATPIGHLGDITIRALEILAASETVLCEDTRTTANLLRRYDIRTPLKPYHDHNAAKVRPAILQALKKGGIFALVSDAGMPLISDPGFKLVREAIVLGIHVEVIPGASAVPTALALSGLPTDRFMFCGFLPTKTGERQKTLLELSLIKATLIFFESPHRIVESLEDIAAVMGIRPVSVSRELTKLHEETLRGSATEVAEELKQRPSIKGEITLVVGPPADAPAAISDADIDQALNEAAQHASASQAAAQVAKRLGLPKKELYARLLALKGNTDGD
jgi:16S rRNA (cytidine1402-2'-O)-methyltransferase